MEKVTLIVKSIKAFVFNLIRVMHQMLPFSTPIMESICHEIQGESIEALIHPNYLITLILIKLIN